MCGGKDLKGFLGEHISFSVMYDSDDDISTLEQQRSADVWSPGLTKAKGELLFGETPPSFAFQRHYDIRRGFKTR